MAEAIVKCLFCQAPSKYSCPQCSIRYCSVQCYQHEDHQLCSEIFYKEQVIKELKDMKGNDEEKRKFLQTLARINKVSSNNNDGVFEEDHDITSRLNDISLDDTDAIWKQLTEDERNTFQKRIQTGNLDFIEVWKPWWEHDNQSIKVIEVESSSKSKRKNMPKILKDLPRIKDILKNKEPDKNIKYSIVEIILIYSLLKRLFNGDLYDSPEETVDVLLSLSKVLSENRLYSDLETCIHCFIDGVVMDKEISIDPVQISLQDLILFLSSPDQANLRSLSELYTFLKRYRKLVRSNIEEKATDVIALLQTFSKKIYFFAVYVADSMRTFKPLLTEVKKIRDGLLEERTILSEQRKDIEANLQTLRHSGKPLIEEL